MRERLVVAFVGLAAAVLIAFSVARAYMVADLVRQGEQQRVDRSADLVALVVQAHLAAEPGVTSAYLTRISGPGERITVVTDGRRVSTSKAPRASADDVSATRTVAPGTRVTVARTADVVERRINDALLPLVLTALALVAAAALLGLLLAGRLARPFRQLADLSRGALPRGRAPVNSGSSRSSRSTETRDSSGTVTALESGIPEARAIGAALTGGAARMRDLQRRERVTAAHASHELRTPVASLRLELEDMALWPETSPALARQLARSLDEVERLSRAIDEVLQLWRGDDSSGVIDLDLDVLLATVVDDERRQGRSVVHRSSGPLPTRLDPDPVEELVSLLVVEVAQRSQGAVQVSSVNRQTHAEVVVAADPDRTPPRTAGAGGWPEDATWRRAVELAAGSGAQLSITTAHPLAVALRLPLRPLSGRAGGDR